MLYRYLFGIFFVILASSYAFATCGKELPLSERADYYERKAASTEDLGKKEKYEKKMFKAIEKIEKQEELRQINRFRKEVQRNKSLAKGVEDGLIRSANDKPTATMIFDPAFSRTEFRKFLSKGWDFDGSKYLSKGTIYAECGGHFQKVNELSEDEFRGMGHSYLYALGTYSEKLEVLTGLQMKQIQAMSAYGLDYLLDLYFDAVDRPAEGDLAVYQSDDTPHAGICKFIDQELIIRSWWIMHNNPHVFEHDPFFVPASYGNRIMFYRLKSNLNDAVDPVLPLAQSMAQVREDGTFVFDPTSENVSIRERITTVRLADLKRFEFPGLIRTKDKIKFFGVCYGYAMGRVFGTYSCPSELPYFECQPQQVQSLYETYFDITTQPEKGDLVVYYAKDPSLSPLSFTHFGMYLGNNMVDSKWGAVSVVEHPIFHVDNGYGKYIRILRKKMTTEAILNDLRNKSQ